MGVCHCVLFSQGHLPLFLEQTTSQRQLFCSGYESTFPKAQNHLTEKMKSLGEPVATATKVYRLLDCCPPSAGLFIHIGRSEAENPNPPPSCPLSAPEDNQRSPLCLLPWPTLVFARSPGFLMTNFPSLKSPCGHVHTVPLPSYRK